ncbi:MAG: WD40/YVTN/BNR-like repeat-containing protein [Flavobacteriaceae bacterium]
MSRLLFICVVMCAILSCKKEIAQEKKDVSNVLVTPLLKDSLLNVRALEIYREEVVIATSQGETFVLGKADKEFKKLFQKDTTHNPNFRALALTDKSVFTISIANPALLYKDGELVYKEDHDKVFYDAIEFWNDNEGIAIGDATDGCLSIIITRDGGNTWTKMSCEELPKGRYSAFAASDTNITIIGDKTWVATGGVQSTVLYSADKGYTWSEFKTPIIQGVETQGMYSIDFYDEKIGFAIGGDYTIPEANAENKIRTVNGGKTWELVAQNSGPGYRSCVQFVPNQKGKELVAIGFEGIDYSNDFGATWQHLSDDSFYTLRFLNDSIAYAAGKGSVARLVFK